VPVGHTGKTNNNRNVNTCIIIINGELFVMCHTKYVSFISF